jgi:hypothetical protein
MVCKPAKGTTGFLLEGRDGEFFFRVYDRSGPEQKFTDYKLAFCDLKVTIDDNFCSFYEGGEGQENKLAYSPRVLGEDNVVKT